MMGLAAQSSRWKLAMEDELVQLAKSSAEATSWQEAAAEDQEASQTLLEKSEAEQTEGDLLEEEGEILVGKGNADNGKAATQEAEGDELAAEAAEASSESDTIFAKAGVQEALAEEDVTKALVHTELATEKGVSAEADEVGTAICQFIPLVDIVCDVVGSMAAVGLESQAVKNAAQSAEEYGTAAALQAKVDAETAQAAELQAAAAEEGEQAVAKKTKVTALEVKADKEIMEGEADEAAAKEELAQSIADETAAEEEEAKAATEEDASAKAWERSLRHGANACGKAIMMSLVSVAALAFWVIRIANSLVVPVARSSANALWAFATRNSRGTKPGANNNNHIFTKNMAHTSSLIVHHALLFVVFFGIWGESLLHLLTLTSVTSMGGLLLGFSSSLAATQVTLMHALPKAFQNEGTLASHFWAGSREFFRWMLVLCPLAIMEIIMVWVNAGSWAFRKSIVEVSRHWWLWGVLVVSTCVHHWNFSRTITNCVDEYSQSDDKAFESDSSVLSLLLNAKKGAEYGTEEIENVEELDEWVSLQEAVEVSEEQHFRTLQYSAATSKTRTENKRCVFTLAKEDATKVRLLLVFEILMASIMLALLRQSTPVLKELWPASKSILLAAYPQWYLLAGMCSGLVVLMLVCACL